MKVITTEKLPIKIWCDEPEEGCIKQARNLANLPFAFKHIAIMPDCHQGYGMPIGGVLATQGVIVPNAVGVDIGCGMMAIETNKRIEEINRDMLKTAVSRIKAFIPMGFMRSMNRCNNSEMPQLNSYCPVVEQEWENARKQLGTLGGGNHFIEIQKSTSGKIWVMIHTGSRNIGKKVGDYYNQLAEQFRSKSYSKVEKEWELAFLDEESDEGKRYIAEMTFCKNFAAKNRKMIMDKIIIESGLNIKEEARIEVPHNYAEIDNHFKHNVWIHRKGAIKARAGDKGIIPGSQGSNSYITKGKGEPQSFMSCSHGAGRAMGRKEAMRNLNIDKEIRKMNDLNIVHEMKSMEQLDEAPSAYKDIHKVMEEQKDLVEIIEELTPIAVIKA